MYVCVLCVYHIDHVDQSLSMGGGGGGEGCILKYTEIPSHFLKLQ